MMTSVGHQQVHRKVGCFNEMKYVVFKNTIIEMASHQGCGSAANAVYVAGIRVLVSQTLDLISSEVLPEK